MLCIKGLHPSANAKHSPGNSPSKQTEVKSPMEIDFPLNRSIGSHILQKRGYRQHSAQELTLLTFFSAPYSQQKAPFVKETGFLMKTHC